MKVFENEEERPSYVCFDCGREYLTEEQNKKDYNVTAHLSNCPICNQNKSVTHIRHFNWLIPQKK